MRFTFIGNVRKIVRAVQVSGQVVGAVRARKDEIFYHDPAA